MRERERQVWSRAVTMGASGCRGCRRQGRAPKWSRWQWVRTIRSSSTSSIGAEVRQGLAAELFRVQAAVLQDIEGGPIRTKLEFAPMPPWRLRSMNFMKGCFPGTRKFSHFRVESAASQATTAKCSRQRRGRAMVFSAMSERDNGFERSPWRPADQPPARRVRRSQPGLGLGSKALIADGLHSLVDLLTEPLPCSSGFSMAQTSGGREPPFRAPQVC